jgi:putative tricarboxylic transport membrane protein
MSKALLMIALGLFVSAVGMDPVNGVERFTFGYVNLANGFDLVAVIMGMFGLSEILLTMEQKSVRDIFAQKIKGLLPNLKDWALSYKPIMRGSALGFFLGILPGGGPVIAAFISYAIERKVSSYPEKFGSGVIEGVAGPESANNAAVAGSLIPLLSLGIPVNAVTALLLGALIIHGVQPGPLLMTQNPDIFWGVIASMYIGNLMLLILNLPLIGIWVQFLKIPYWILFPLIFLMCAIGSYTSNSNIFDVWVMIGFGLIGYCLRKFQYELAPFILALILGPMFDQSLRQSLIISKQDPMIFFTRPISGILLALAVVSLAWVLWGKRKNKINPV